MHLSGELQAICRHNEPLYTHSTFHVGGKARLFAQPTTRHELLALLLFARDEGLPYVIVGEGSNILFADADYRGMVISLKHFEQDHIVFRQHVVQATAGMSLAKFVVRCAQHSLGGVEFLSSIPGSLGGAVMMNAGFGSHNGDRCEIGQHVQSVTVMDHELHMSTVLRNDLHFEYRKSNLSGLVVIDVTLALRPVSWQQVKQIMAEQLAYRKRVQDLRFPSAGSIFKNPTDCRWTSGELIERVGLKGHCIGEAQISDRHANFIVNRGCATAGDILALIALAQERVFTQFGIQLELEVRYVGA